MTNHRLLARLLQLRELKITGFQFKNRDKELHLSVKPYKNKVVPVFKTAD